VTPTIVIVGAASRDLTEDDPRGWRLGGGVTYSALVAGRLGVPTGALVGVDALSANAHELDLLREAGVDLRTVVLDRAPVFRNIERPEGRLQLSEGPSDVVPPESVPEDWLAAPGWILTPVAAELPDAWADAPSAEATVAVGWQGLLDPGRSSRGRTSRASAATTSTRRSPSRRSRVTCIRGRRSS
jgi:sugar/nucleoside kinase (ribokinase family)